MGIRSLALYVLIFLCLKVIRKLSPSLTIVVADGFYTIGSLIIGGGHVVDDNYILFLGSSYVIDSIRRSHNSKIILGWLLIK